MNESLKTIVAGLVPHVREALRIYTSDSESALQQVRIEARARIQGYLLAVRNSGNLCAGHCDHLLDEIRTADGHRIIAACFEPKKPPITEGERSLHRYKYRYKYRACGSFEGLLWDAIVAADSTNLDAIAKGFPEHVTAYRRFANEFGYLDALCKRIEAGE